MYFLGNFLYIVTITSKINDFKRNNYLLRLLPYLKSFYVERILWSLTILQKGNGKIKRSFLQRLKFKKL